MAHAEFGEGLLDIGEGIEDFALAQDAYIYGYPLVTMEMTRRVITNVANVEGTHGPMGQIIKLREYPNASFRDVTAPNAQNHQLRKCWPASSSASPTTTRAGSCQLSYQWFRPATKSQGVTILVGFSFAFPCSVTSALNTLSMM